MQRSFLFIFSNAAIICFLQLIRFTETRICTKSSANIAWITWYVMFPPTLPEPYPITFTFLIFGAFLCFYLQMKNADYFSNYVTEDFTTYINRKRKNNCHGNHIEMQAMAEMYNRPVEVYQYGTGERCTQSSAIIVRYISNGLRLLCSMLNRHFHTSSADMF